ncbi:hypothetical protein [Alteromonas ponticola]|uniref:DUF4402 domain-containing protein n=1 Tax=Alteromonas ponticola TaxID=2720613 RepID=A0ABX1R579_9ALTE|nr:hypothetical protein [Alteromonas ponticola]NMH60811.1 hypothetical protein [Alteromonas ponticola]
MTAAGEVSGDCNVVDDNIMLGQVTVTDLPRDAQVEVVVNGLSNPMLSFAPTVRVSGGSRGTTTLSDGQPGIVETNGNGGDLIIDVYGVVILRSNLAAGATYSADFSVQVNQL